MPKHSDKDATQWSLVPKHYPSDVNERSLIGCGLSTSIRVLLIKLFTAIKFKIGKENIFVIRHDIYLVKSEIWIVSMATWMTHKKNKPKF